MRKIITQEKQNKKTKRNQLVIGLVLIVLMLFSVIGYALSGRGDDNSKTIEYNEIKFTQDNSGYWNFKIQGQNLITKYNPKETEDISFFNSLNMADYSNKPLYLIGGFAESNYEIARNLNSFVLRTQEACLNEKDCLKDFPIKNCSIDNIIVIKEPEEDLKEKIYQEENCLFITASLQNQTRYTDAFLFKILGI